MTTKTLLPALLAVAMLASGAAAFTLPWQKQQTQAMPPPRPVASMIVSDDPATSHSVPGVIAARIEVALAFQTLGRVTARNVDIGVVVRQDDLLASLDPDDLQGNVRAAQAAVEAAQVELRTARASAERARALAQRNVTSTAQLEQAERALAAAQATAQRTQSELIRAADAEGFAEMRAPFDGVISMVYANAGAVVSAGEPVLQLSSQHGIEAVIDLPDTALAPVRLNDRYEVWSESQSEDPVSATVSQIEPVADAVTRTRRVHLALANDATFRLGAFVRARPAGSGATRLTLPAAAILERDGTSQVWVVTRTGSTATVALRQITTAGPTLYGLVTIAAGLQPGDEVVVRGIHSLSAGQPVGPSVTP